MSNFLVKFNFVLLLLLSSLNAGSWHSYGFNTQRESRIQEICEPPLTPVWTFEIQGNLLSSPITYKGNVYFTGTDTSIWALNKKTGEVIWQYSTSGGIESSPAAYKDRIFVASTDGNIYAFKYEYLFDEDPDPIWVYNTNSTLRSSPAIYKDKIYFVSGFPKGEVYELDINGNLVRSWNVPSFANTSVVIKDNYLALGLNNGKFYTFDLTTGSEIYSEQTLGNFTYTNFLIDDNNRLFIPTNRVGSKLISYNLTTKSEMYETPDLMPEQRTINSGPACLDDKLLICYTAYSDAIWDDVLKILAVNKSDGSIIFTQEVGIPHKSGLIATPVVVNDTIYVGSGDGILYVLTSTGGIKATYNLGSPIVAAPCVSNGYLYVPTYDGKLHAFKGTEIISIISPDNYDLLQGTIEVKGTILPNSMNYKLEYKRVDDTVWHFISSGTTSGENVLLGLWDTSLNLDGEYELKLTVGGNKTAINKVRINNPPRPPRNLTAETLNITFDKGYEIRLNWEKSMDDSFGSKDVKSYFIYRSTASGVYDHSTPIGTVTCGITNYVDKIFVAFTTFYYVVRSYDGVYLSTTSNEASIYVYFISESTQTDTENRISMYVPVDKIEVPVQPDLQNNILINFSGDIVKLEIPKGVIETEDTLIIEKVNQDVIPSPEDAIPVSPIFSFEFANNNLSENTKDITIYISYINSRNIQCEDLLRMYKVVDDNWKMLNTSRLDKDNKFVCADVKNLSLFRVMELKPSPLPLREEEVYVYPNPVTTGKATFKYRLGYFQDKLEIKINIYNLAGEHIWSYNRLHTPVDIGKTHEIVWDVSDVASGMYLFVFDAKGLEKPIVKKMAIIH